MTETVVDETSGEAGIETLPVPSVGACLQAARETAGLKVADIAQTLKLGVRQVEALEKDEWSILPGATFIRGVVRNYARLVALDPAPLLQQLDGLLTRPASVVLALPETRPSKDSFGGSGGLRGDRVVVLSGLVLVLLAVFAYFLLDLDSWREEVKSVIDSLSRKEEVAQNQELVVAPVAAPSAPEPVFPPGTTPQQVFNPQAAAVAEASPPVAEAGKPLTNLAAAPLSFIVDAESWIEVRDRDGKVVFSQRSAAATQPAVDAPGPLSLVIGYAPGVKVFWRGRAVDLAPHTRGDVARLVLE